MVFPDAQTVYGELLLARGLVKEAAAELASAGRRLDPRGIRNPAWCPWQLHLARAERHDTPERAVVTAHEAVARARQFGTPSAIGQALRVAAEVSSGSARAKLLEESVTHLERSPAAYELACALVALGTELRRTGRSREAATTSTEASTQRSSAAPTASPTQPAPNWPRQDCAPAASTAPRPTPSPPRNAPPRPWRPRATRMPR